MVPEICLDEQGQPILASALSTITHRNAYEELELCIRKLSFCFTPYEEPRNFRTLALSPRGFELHEMQDEAKRKRDVNAISTINDSLTYQIHP